jgi:DNA repair photolyase
MKPFHGKVIYNPSGKAGEYSYWAANFYNGCSATCEYCYNRHGRAAKVLGGDVPSLKKSLIDVGTAFQIFKKETLQNLKELRKYGLFFNFVSDPMLPKTIELNTICMRYCITKDITVKVLTKQTWWVNNIIEEMQINETFWNLYRYQKYINFGFTLTGHDELEPGAATNAQRIEAMKKLHNAGFKTWASIEPIIDFKSSWLVFNAAVHAGCDLFKIGLLSGKKYDFLETNDFINKILEESDRYINRFKIFNFKIYFKDSLLKKGGFNSKDEYRDLNLNSHYSFCVNRNFNL